MRTLALLAVTHEVDATADKAQRDRPPEPRIECLGHARDAANNHEDHGACRQHAKQDPEAGRDGEGLLFPGCLRFHCATIAEAGCIRTTRISSKVGRILYGIAGPSL